MSFGLQTEGQAAIKRQTAGPVFRRPRPIAVHKAQSCVKGAQKPGKAKRLPRGRRRGLNGPIADPGGHYENAELHSAFQLRFERLYNIQGRA